MTQKERDMLTDAEQIKLCMARWIYRKIDDVAPSGKKTWRQWFVDNYGEQYDDYVKRMQVKTKKINAQTG